MPPKPTSTSAKSAAADTAETIPAGGGPKLGLLWLARLLFLAAMGISSYLAYKSLGGGTVAGCGVGSSCDSVLTSRWAYWFSFPVSLPAAAFYVVLLIASLFALPGKTPQTQAKAWTILIAGAFAVLGAALWFVGLQAVIIGSWCKYCVTAHTLGGVGALLVLVSAPFVIRGPAGAQPVLFGVNRRAWPAIMGMLALVPLVAGQFLAKPPASQTATVAPTEVSAVETAAVSTNEASTKPDGPAPGATTAPATPKPSRMFSLHRGQYTFDLYEVPMMGRPDATNVIVSLFDYTCAHCRQQHGLLKRVQATFGNELGIVLLPMPLDKECNPLLTATGPDHVNACEYARIGMAVWRTSPGVLSEYEEWFFEPEHPRPIPEVLAKAKELTGNADFEKAMADPWIDDWLKTGRNVFKTNWDLTGRNFLPMVNIGGVLSSGIIKDDAELYGVLEQQFGLKRVEAK